MRNLLPEVMDEGVHFVKVGPNNGVQDSLTMCPVHEKKCRYLTRNAIILMVGIEGLVKQTGTKAKHPTGDETIGRIEHFVKEIVMIDA